jgi:hypothetical protein
MYEVPFWNHIHDFWEPHGDDYPVEKFPESRPCHGAEDIAHCFWLRHRRIFRQEDHLTLRGALRAFGLSGRTLQAVRPRG